MNIDDAVLMELGLASSLARAAFRDVAEFWVLPKNKLLVEEGKPNEFEYIVVAGVLHRFCESVAVEAVTTGFYVAPSVVMPHFARTHRGRSVFSLQSLTDLVVAAIPVVEFDRLRYSNDEFRALGQRVIERELVRSVQHEVVLRTVHAKERLLALREEYPNLENLIPHHIIASYLGVTPVSLSRLRHELAKK